MPRNPAGSLSMISSQYVAEEAFPWTNRTGVPSSDPLKSTCIFRRGVSTNFDVIPGNVGIVDILCSFSRYGVESFLTFVCGFNIQRLEMLSPIFAQFALENFSCRRNGQAIHERYRLGDFIF